MKTRLLLALPFIFASSMLPHAQSEIPSRASAPRADEKPGARMQVGPSFRRHVLPLLGRSGCNGRECHGSFSGQGGFQLSLFGYDFERDHREITADPDDGSRVNLKQPAASLLLLKPTMQEKHKGKERFKKGSWEYELLRKWIVAGAKNDATETGEFDRLEVWPKEIVFRAVGEAVQLRVVARWKDGTAEEVTFLTRFRTNDDSVATVSESGSIQSKGKGDTHVVAFYDNGVQPIPVMLPSSDLVGARYPQIATPTKVDELVTSKLRKLGIVPSERCTDAEFLRRVSLDLAGTLPTPKEVEAFLADRTADKRARKIEALLASPGYAGWWATKLCDFTGNLSRGLSKGLSLSQNLSPVMSRQWYEWIARRMAENTPYDQLAKGIVLATSRTSPEQSYKDFALEMGSYFRAEAPADFGARPNMPYFWQRYTKPEERALGFAHAFLGVRIECAQCHKHPFDQWTKTDFEQFQVFFAAVNYGPRPPRKDAPADEMSFQSVSQELAGAAGAGMMPGAEKGKAPDKNAAPKKVPVKKGQMKKGEGDADEGMRRLRLGEPLAWPEVFVDLRRVLPAKPGEKQKKAEGNSRVLTPKLLGGEEVMVQQYADPRRPLVDWLCDKENSYFAKAFVNRAWAHYFGRGIVDPADDLNLANAPSNAELLDYLARSFAARRYDMKWLHREILNSETYQRSWKPNVTNLNDEKNFSHAVIRRLPAEVVLDAINIATASEAEAAQFANDLSQRAIGLAGDTAAATYKLGKGGAARMDAGYALAIFGRPARESNCDCERTADPTLLQTLFTRNDPDFLQRLERASDRSTWIDHLRGYRPPTKGGSGNEKAKMKMAPDGPQNKKPFIKMPDGRRVEKGGAEGEKRIAPDEPGKANPDGKKNVRKEAASFTPPPPLNEDAAIREVFLRTVSRPPTPQEFAIAREEVAAAATPIDGIRDLLWAMLNTREFMVNH